jgi:hypothetical protein
MSRSIWIVCLLVTLVAGFALGRHGSVADRRSAATPEPANPDLRAPVRVARWAREQPRQSQAPERSELNPYRVIVDGRRVFDTLDGKPKSGDVWQIDLADGRIVILAVRTPDPE